MKFNREDIMNRWLAATLVLAAVYGIGNISYTYWRLKGDRESTWRSWAKGFLFGIPALLASVFLVWVLPMVLPDTFKVGGDRLSEK